jgi:hypothetical protein
VGDSPVMRICRAAPSSAFVNRDTFSATFRQVLAERLAVRRQPNPATLNDHVVVAIQSGIVSGYELVVHERDGGDLRAWRDALAMLVEDAALEALLRMGEVEPLATTVTLPRTAWERLDD